MQLIKTAMERESNAISQFWQWEDRSDMLLKEIYAIELVPTTGCEGRKGARCFFTPIGPMPGPPPPWGIQNVLWRLR